MVFKMSWCVIAIFLKLKVKVMSNSLRLFASDSSSRSPWNSPGQNTGGNISLLLGIFPTQGSNLGLPHCQWILYQLSHKGSSRILEWVAYPFSSSSSWPRNWTWVSCIAGGFFINWAIREVLLKVEDANKKAIQQRNIDSKSKYKWCSSELHVSSSIKAHQSFTTSLVRYSLSTFSASDFITAIFCDIFSTERAFYPALVVKESACQCRRPEFDP